MEILAAKDLSFTYPTCENPALDGVSLSLNKGEFVLLCGSTGSGKSTLLRMLKPQLTPLGTKSGAVYYKGREADECDPTETACRIGFVMQAPEEQTVCDKVWHELAFGLENLGLPHQTIARKVAEMAAYFGIEDWYEKDVSELSGGQKQLLNLASVMVTGPEVLILDEPTSRLDPIAASDFILTLKKLCDDLSLTILCAEHRLEELIPLCDRLVVMENGRIVCDAPPRETVRAMSSDDPLLAVMPTPVRVFRTVGADLSAVDKCPLTLREGRRMIESTFANTVKRIGEDEYKHSQKAALEMRGVYFRYSRELDDVLCGLDLAVYEGEIFCMIGGNGAGKSTALSCAAGLVKPYSGVVKVFGKKLGDYKNNSLYDGCLALLPQEVQTVFLKNTVREELEEAGADADALPFDLTPLYERHPYDLSGGEQQLTALAKVLARKPKLLLCDEPTKGLDAVRKKILSDIFRKLKAEGITIVIVTHDMEFAAECADRCAMLFKGNIVTSGTPREFFSSGSFYTTSAARMTQGFFDDAVTADDVCRLCRMNGKRGSV